MAAATIMLRDRPSPQSPHHVAVTVDGHPPLPVKGPGEPDYDKATPAQAIAFTCMEFLTDATNNDGVRGASSDEQAEAVFAAQPPNRWQGFKDVEIEALADAFADLEPHIPDAADQELQDAAHRVRDELVRERVARGFIDGGFGADMCRPDSPLLGRRREPS